MNTDSLDSVDPGTAFSLAGALYAALALWAGLHVVMNKRNEASAFSWLGIIVLAPWIGALLYWLFGINRIRRRVQAELSARSDFTPDYDTALCVSADPAYVHWHDRMKFGLGVHKASYLSGNNLDTLRNGDQAYLAMLVAIKGATHSVVLSSYIFEYDDIGKQFVTALVAAHRRGVMVRVMIDGLGVGYGLSLVRADRILRRQGVKTARFLSAWSTSGTRFINLRNHRKILSVDGKVAFVGGMNIRDNNLLRGIAKHKTQDIHFKVQGRVVDQINRAFTSDWKFASGETLHLPRWQCDGVKRAVTSRVLLDGPDDNFQKLSLTILGALHSATSRVLVVTPYFLPDKTIRNALQLAVLRGVSVSICVPQTNNLPFVGWAMQANQSDLLSIGVKLYETPAPFDHSKLFIVDNDWSLVGSSNWDARSLELNFEINLESYDQTLNDELAGIINAKIANATLVSNKRHRHAILRLRNNFFRLFSPYL